MRKSANVEKRRCHVARAALRSNLKSATEDYANPPKAVPAHGSRTHRSLQSANGGVSERYRVSPQEQAAIRFAIDLVQGKWKIGILCRLQERPARLGDLRRLFPQASKKMLTQHLRQMEQDGIITRTDLSGKVPRVEYSLSNSLGRPVMNLIDLLVQWGEQHSAPSDVRLYPAIEPPTAVFSP